MRRRPEYFVNKFAHAWEISENDELVSESFDAFTRWNFMTMFDLDDAGKHECNSRKLLRFLLISSIEFVSSALNFYVFRGHVACSCVVVSHLLHLWALSHEDQMHDPLLKLSQVMTEIFFSRFLFVLMSRFVEDVNRFRLFWLLSMIVKELQNRSWNSSRITHLTEFESWVMMM
jgi:hypothetical protein